ncbi:hypothetical protein ERO13_D06G154500v2 [Gossypium hirsutum]|uniref:Uncharacterized protein isoform X1 n=3 Tax=Gossypium TaxID=3633 RepID=A0A1U8IZX1_GOSHI|nr:uncharacterized protein LOC107901959 isoform X1 [Gossypium hirsutum]KAG4142884.1 hypothetical protein ERO13_D06G154500v2 [Gossypium hirsutum]TYH67576.1 hypothetical protein ES332_D06G197400v1 [Gossypium tomentosum]
MLMEKFTEKERELRTSSLTRKQSNTGSKETSLDEMLCRHKERKPFAYGLRNECYEEVSTHVPTRRSYLLLPATIVPLETVLSLKLKFMLLLVGAIHKGFRRARWRIRSTSIPAC